jgi:uncharacterized protein
MKTSLFILLIGLPLFLFAQEGTKNFIDFNYIEVTGTAEMEIIPDEIYLKILVDEKDNKGKQSLEDLEKQMFRKLEKIGIDVSKELSIIDFTSNFKNYFLRDDKIFTRKEYQLIVHDGKTAGKVFQELEEIGISNISIEKVDHSKLDDFKKEVKVKAIKAAREKAVFMVEAIGQSIGGAIYIQEINNNVFQGRLAGVTSNIVIRGLSSVKQQNIVQEPQIEFEKINLEYSVLVRFELQR